MEKNKQKALLLNLFVLPGAGHLQWGKKQSGYIFVTLILVLLGIVFLIYTWGCFTEARLFVLQGKALSPWTLLKGVWDVYKSWFIAGFVLMGLVWLASVIDILRRK